MRGGGGRQRPRGNATSMAETERATSNQDYSIVLKSSTKAPGIRQRAWIELSLHPTEDVGVSTMEDGSLAAESGTAQITSRAMDTRRYLS